MIGDLGETVLRNLTHKAAASQPGIFDLWLACHTQEEIAEREDCDQSVVSDVIRGSMEIGSLAESHKAVATHLTDFDIPLYNVWKQEEKTPTATIPSGSLIVRPNFR
jgi:hypothetical protein